MIPKNIKNLGDDIKTIFFPAILTFTIIITLFAGHIFDIYLLFLLLISSLIFMLFYLIKDEENGSQDN